MRKTIVISLGGSVLVPDDIDVAFLKMFSELIRDKLEDYRFIIIPGGGKTARDHIKAASSITDVKDSDLDWLGIHATRLNAHLLRTVFVDIAFKRIIKNPNEKVDFDDILIASGWRPGFSTDYCAVVLADTYDASSILNITNTDYVYDKDPKTNEDAERLEHLTWSELQGLVGTEWSPGMNAPFDPIATKKAAKMNLRLLILGSGIENIENAISNRSFRGTTVE